MLLLCERPCEVDEKTNYSPGGNICKLVSRKYKELSKLNNKKKKMGRDKKKHLPEEDMQMKN